MAASPSTHSVDFPAGGESFLEPCDSSGTTLASRAVFGGGGNYLLPPSRYVEEQDGGGSQGEGRPRSPRHPPMRRWNSSCGNQSRPSVARLALEPAAHAAPLPPNSAPPRPHLGPSRPAVIRYVHNHFLPAAPQKHSVQGRLGLFLGVCFPSRSRLSFPRRPSRNGPRES